ncbi:MAG: ABC transporter permease [Prevotella sp.]|nr:ABC transporter permease [Prevotella sp.]
MTNNSHTPHHHSLASIISEGLHDVFHICVQELRQTFRDEGMLIFFILVPLAYPILYSWIYQEQLVREVPVVVVDDSNSSRSREFTRLFDASPDVAVVARCTDMTEARKAVGRQEAFGIIRIPSSFATDIARGKQTAVALYCDMSIMLNYKAILQTATAVAGDMNAGIQISQSGNTTARQDEITTRPLDFDEVALFNPTGGYADFILPGVLILILHQTLLLGIGLGAGTAREQNRYEDLVPVSRHYNGTFRIVMGKAWCYFMIYLAVGAYVILAVPSMFGFLQLLSAGPLLALITPFLLATIFFGMTISCIVRYRENILLIVVFTTVPLLFLSGMSWPQSAMPGAWQAVAGLFPSTFGIRGFIRLNTMGATLQDIRTEYIALWIQTVAYFLAACAVYRHQLRMTRRHEAEECTGTEA